MRGLTAYWARSWAVMRTVGGAGRDGDERRRLAPIETTGAAVIQPNAVSTSAPFTYVTGHFPAPINRLFTFASHCCCANYGYMQHVLHRAVVPCLHIPAYAMQYIRVVWYIYQPHLPSPPPLYEAGVASAATSPSRCWRGSRCSRGSRRSRRSRGRPSPSSRPPRRLSLSLPRC